MSSLKRKILTNSKFILNLKTDRVPNLKITMTDLCFEKRNQMANF